MKIKCLRCDVEFEAIRESAKFCSANCRVKWNYKNKKTKKQISFSVVENRVLDLLDKLESKIIFKQTTPESYDGKKLDKINYDEPSQWQQKKESTMFTPVYDVIEVYKSKFEAAKSYHELEKSVKAMEAEVMTWKQKHELREYAGQIKEEKGFFTD